MSYAQHVTVAKSGGDFSTIQSAIDAITDATVAKRYLIQIYPGLYTEQVTMKDWIDLRGVSKHDVELAWESSAGGVKLANFCQLEDVVIGLSANEGDWGIVGANVSHWHLRNVDALSPFDGSKRGSFLKVTGASWTTGFLEHSVVNCHARTTPAIWLERSGFGYVDVTFNDVFPDTLSATTGGGSIYLKNLADIQLRGIYGRTSSAGYGLRVAGVLSEVELVGSYLRYGAPSLKVEPSNTVRMVHAWAQSISGGGTAINLADEDVVVMGPIETPQIVDRAVTYPKLSAAPAFSLLGRGTGVGDWGPIGIGDGLELVSGSLRAIPPEIPEPEPPTEPAPIVVGLLVMDGGLVPPELLTLEDGTDYLAADGVS